MDELTKPQRGVLEALRRRADQSEPVPTYRELCAEFGWASTGTVRDHLRALVRKGHVKLTGKHRQIRLLDQRPAAASVPLVGRVVAGLPAISDENIEQWIPVPAEWARRSTLFALRVTGDSMRDAGILEGDRIVVRHQPVAGDRDVVVATVEGETTVKRLRLRKGRVMLVPENSRYRPIEVRSVRAVIHGVVVGVLRAYGNGQNGWPPINRSFRASKGASA
jgi:repressor LexA